MSEDRDYLTTEDREYLAMMKNEELRKRTMEPSKLGAAYRYPAVSVLDFPPLRMDEDAGVYVAKEHVEALQRIEAKLDVLLSALPERPCTPEMPTHMHGENPTDVRPLRKDEQPYPTCYGFEGGPGMGR